MCIYQILKFTYLILFKFYLYIDIIGWPCYSCFIVPFFLDLRQDERCGGKSGRRVREAQPVHGQADCGLPGLPIPGPKEVWVGFQPLTSCPADSVLAATCLALI